MDRHYHPRRRRAGWIFVSAEGASQAFVLRGESAIRTDAHPCGSTGPRLAGDLARGKNASCPRGKTVTNSVWCW